MFCLRRVAFRAFSSPSLSLSAGPRSITTLTPSVLRVASNRSDFPPLQRRWASEEVTQSEPEADGATEAQQGENSIAAASKSEAPESADQDDQSTVTSAIKSTAESVSAQASAAAESVGAAAKTTSDYVTGHEQPDRPARIVQESANVYIGNLFFDVTAEDLKQEFSKAGNVDNVKIIYDSRGLSKGFGYISFTSIQEARKAIEMFNMNTYQGRRISVQFTLNRQRLGGADRTIARSPNNPSKTLFIGNMAFDMSDRDLNNLFREIKNVIDVRVAIDRRTGQPRGFAHADFADVDSAEKAMEALKDKEVCGRVLRVDYSTSSGRSAMPPAELQE